MTTSTRSRDDVDQTLDLKSLASAAAESPSNNDVHTDEKTNEEPCDDQNRERGCDDENNEVQEDDGKKEEDQRSEIKLEDIVANISSSSSSNSRDVDWMRNLTQFLLLYWGGVKMILMSDEVRPLDVAQSLH